MYKEIIAAEKERIETAIRLNDSNFLNKRYHGVANARHRLNSLNYILSEKKRFGKKKAAG